MGSKGRFVAPATRRALAAVMLAIGGGEAFLTGVSCTAANACMAFGVHRNPNIGFAERWNGTGWSRHILVHV